MRKKFLRTSLVQLAVTAVLQMWMVPNVTAKPVGTVLVVDPDGAHLRMSYKLTIDGDEFDGNDGISGLPSFQGRCIEFRVNTATSRGASIKVTRDHGMIFGHEQTWTGTIINATKVDEDMTLTLDRIGTLKYNSGLK